MQGGMHFWPPHWLPGWFPVDFYWLVPMSTRGWREEVKEVAGRSSRPRPVKPQQVFMLIPCSPPAAPPPVGALQLHKPTPPFTPLSLVFLHLYPPPYLFIVAVFSPPLRCPPSLISCHCFHLLVPPLSSPPPNCLSFLLPPFYHLSSSINVTEVH